MRAAHCCGSFHLLPYSLVLQVLHWYFISAGFPEVLLCNLFLAGFRYCFTLVSTFGGIPLLFYTGIYFWRDFSTVLLWYMFSAGFLYHPTLVHVFSGIPLPVLRSGTSFQRDFNLHVSSSVGIRQERLSPVTGAAFPAPGRALINRQSLRLALTGSDMKLCGDS